MEPRCIKEGYVFINDNEEWDIKKDAPEWAKQEFKEFMEQVNPKPNEEGIIIQM